MRKDVRLFAAEKPSKSAFWCGRRRGNPEIGLGRGRDAHGTLADVVLVALASRLRTLVARLDERLTPVKRKVTDGGVAGALP